MSTARPIVAGSRACSVAGCNKNRNPGNECGVLEEPKIVSLQSSDHPLIVAIILGFGIIRGKREAKDRSCRKVNVLHEARHCQLSEVSKNEADHHPKMILIDDAL